MSQCRHKNYTLHNPKNHKKKNTEKNCKLEIKFIPGEDEDRGIQAAENNSDTNIHTYTSVYIYMYMLKL